MLKSYKNKPCVSLGSCSDQKAVKSCHKLSEAVKNCQKLSKAINCQTVKTVKNKTAMPIFNDYVQCLCAMPMWNAYVQCLCAMPMCNALGLTLLSPGLVWLINGFGLALGDPGLFIAKFHSEASFLINSLCRPALFCIVLNKFPLKENRLRSENAALSRVN